MCKIHQSELCELMAALQQHNESRVKIHNSNITVMEIEEQSITANNYSNSTYSLIN